MTPVWEEPVRGGFPGPRLLGLSGLEQLRSIEAGLAPRPPIHHLTGMVPAEQQPGSSVFTMPASPWLLSPPGLLLPGALAILADGPLGSAIQSTLAPLTAYTTAELSMNYVRPVTPESGTLVARGRLILAGRSLGLSDCLIEDGHGRVVAHGTSRCVIFPPFGPPPDEPPDLPPVDHPVYDTPDPHLRPVEGGPVPQETWDGRSGLEIMRGLADAALVAPPIHHLTGLHPTEADEGSCTFAMPASAWLCSPLGKLEGGTIAMLADAALGGAVQTTIPAGSSFAPLDLKVNFLRPVDPTGDDLVARARVTHRGRTIAVADAELEDAEGRRVAIATGTSMILPDRPWRVDRPVDASTEAGG